MSKFSLFLASLVGALPGGALAALMVLVFLNHADHAPGAFQAVAGCGLVLGGSLGLMPLAILLFAGPRTPKKPRPEAEPSAAAKTADASAADLESTHDEELLDEDALEPAAEEAGDEVFGEEVSDFDDSAGHAETEPMFNADDDEAVAEAALFGDEESSQDTDADPDAAVTRDLPAAEGEGSDEFDLEFDEDNEPPTKKK